MILGVEKHLQQAILNTGLNQIDTLSPYEFEEWVARFLRMCGYNAYATKKSGDFGADVLAEKDNIKIAIQVKKFINSPIGIRSVQEVSSAMDYYDATEGWVISTARYCSNPAKELASKRDIKLYCKNDLAIMFDDLLKSNNKDIAS